MAWKSATPQLELVLVGVPASQFHSTDVESRPRRARRSGSLIRQVLHLDQEDAYAAGEVDFLARALAQATLPHSWLTRRFFRLRKPVTIPWASLALQFGCGYANPRHFKKRFLGYLRSVIDYYPEVRLENAPAGLLLKPSPTHAVPRTAQR